MNIFDAIIACGAQERLDIAKAMDSDIEKGGPGSGRHAVYMNSPTLARSEKTHHLHGKLIKVYDTKDEAKENATSSNYRRTGTEKQLKVKYHVVSHEEDTK